MKKSELTKILFIFLLLNLNCAHNVPKGFLKSPSSMRDDVFGGWLQVKFKDSSQIVSGELLTIDESYLYVLTEKEEFIYIDKDKVKEITLWFYDAEGIAIVFWTLAGVLSTVSHGFAAIFTAPLWLVAGILAGISVEYSGEVKYPGTNFDELKKYSRYPQGFPDGVPPNILYFKRF